MVCVETTKIIFNHIEPVFITSVNLDALLPLLLQHQLLTDDDFNDFKFSDLSKVQRAEILLQYLRHKEHGTLQKLLCCLNRESTHLEHNDIATKLSDTMRNNNLVYEEICLDCRLKGVIAPSSKTVCTIAGKSLLKSVNLQYSIKSPIFRI